MKKKIDTLLSLVIITIFLPLFITIICQRMQLEDVLYGELSASVESGQTEDIEEKVIGIAAKEIGAKSEEEAIRAQCVIARTNLYDALARNTDEPKAFTTDEMKKLWGDDYEKIYDKFKTCAAETKDEVLTWNGRCIYAAYHALSAGQTRDMTEFSGDAKLPYLTAQECRADITAEGYLAVTYCKKDDFIRQCQEAYPEAGITELSQLEVVSRDGAGYVEEMKVAGTTCMGEEFRSRMGWNSACFTVTEVDGEVRIVTKGLGHGFGLSQNEAKHMAGEGKTYEEILAYFYPGAELMTADQLQ